VTDQTAPNLNGGNTPPAQTSPPENTAEKTVPEIVQNFRAIFESMSEQLEFGSVKDENGVPRALGESDIRGFLSDVMEFRVYIRKWEREEWLTKKADLDGSIQSMDGMRENLQEIGVELNTALAVDAILNPTSLDTVQFVKGKKEYFKFLVNCSNLISRMLRDCFVPKIDK
jgi:hypothetical protein